MKFEISKAPFEKCLATAKNRMKKAQAELEMVELLLRGNNISDAASRAFDFADAAERLALVGRELPAFTGNPRARILMEDKMLEVIPIRIGFTKERWFFVSIPILLPRKAKGSPAFIRDALHPAMSRFFLGKNPVRYDDCVLIFRHVYNRERPEREYRDHDNVELSSVVNIIALHILYDDAPLRCAHYYCSASGEKDETQVFVVPRDEFGSWLDAEKNYNGREILLYENPY